MKVKTLLSVLIDNKIVWYIFTRYLTYGISFIVTICIASNMGPYYYGIWGFLLLMLNYFNLINWGIPQAVQVFLVQYKTKELKCIDYEKTGAYLVLLMSLGCIAVAIYYSIGGFKLANKYNISFLFYVICLCGILNYFNLFYSKIYRARNRIFEIAFQQTSVVICMAIVIFFFRGKDLLYALVICYLVAYLSSLCLYIFNGGARFNGHFIKRYAKDISKKGMFLFLYNSGFYLIIVSTKTFVSSSYTVEEFGYFSFAYLLGHAVYQLLEAFSFLLTTKLLDRYRSDNVEIVLSTIKLIRVNFVALFHGVMYLAMLFFPFLLSLVPKYKDTIQVVYLCCLTMLLYTNSFGYSTLLMARNKEKNLAIASISTLTFNIILCYTLINYCNVGFEYAILATMVAYLYYAIFCVYLGRKELNKVLTMYRILTDCFPISLLIPFVSAVYVALFNNSNLMFVPLILFVILNMKTIRKIVYSFKKILFHPDVIDV